MKITRCTEKDLPNLAAFWNEGVAAGTLYKPLTAEEFMQTFARNPHFDYDYCLACYGEGSENTLVGFAQGICKKTFLPGETHENTPGYITMVAVKPEYRRQGIGTKLLNALEEAFKAAGKPSADVLFFNPINLIWVIPGTTDHVHPNTPGVLKDSPAQAFFTKNGYESRAEQNAYHRTLAELPPGEDIPKIKSIRASLKEKNIDIEPYREGYHFDLDGLFDNLRNEHWRKDIKDNLAAHPEWPLLVVSDKGRVVGFAGPIYPQPSGRGFFSGIGVHSEYGGMGIGTDLFYRLCETERERGATYMTLFTGVTNPARKLYESAGFDIAATWVTMRKEI